MAAKDQDFNALPVDNFDLAIRKVPDDRNSLHAKVELVFDQDKGSNKTEVVTAVSFPPSSGHLT
jgi:hypothetical protein